MPVPLAVTENVVDWPALIVREVGCAVMAGATGQMSSCVVLVAPRYEAVMFVDVRSFTAGARERSPQEVVDRLDNAFAVLVVYSRCLHTIGEGMPPDVCSYYAHENVVTPGLATGGTAIGPHS